MFVDYYVTLHVEFTYFQDLPLIRFSYTMLSMRINIAFYYVYMYDARPFIACQFLCVYMLYRTCAPVIICLYCSLCWFVYIITFINVLLSCVGGKQKRVDCFSRTIFQLRSERICFLTRFRGGVAQWVARLTRDRWILISREFEPHQRSPLFPWARNFTLIA